MAISKRLRYEIFRRDGFQCRYCGTKPPEAQLRPDHVIPVALGGSDDPSNLVTACEPCNTGKTSLGPDAPVIADVSEAALRWSRAMVQAAERMCAEMAGRQEIYDQFDEWWCQWSYGIDHRELPRPADWRSSVDSFLAAGLPLDVLHWCAETALSSRAAEPWKYMCGIAWKKVRELQDVAVSVLAEA